jgi:hypothetical protein
MDVRNSGGKFKGVRMESKFAHSISRSQTNVKRRSMDFPEYKSFKTGQLAEQPFPSDSREFIGKDSFHTKLTKEQLKLIGVPTINIGEFLLQKE